MLYRSFLSGQTFSSPASVIVLVLFDLARFLNTMNAYPEWTIYY